MFMLTEYGNMTYYTNTKCGLPIAWILRIGNGNWTYHLVGVEIDKLVFHSKHEAMLALLKVFGE